MDIQKLSEETGCDLQAALARLGGMTSLYEKLLKKFTTDTTFQDLRKAVKQREAKEIEMYAHTLKGVAANLGFTTLCNVSNEIVIAVRQGDLENAIDRFEECEVVYIKIHTAVCKEI